LRVGGGVSDGLVLVLVTNPFNPSGNAADIATLCFTVKIWRYGYGTLSGSKGRHCTCTIELVFLLSCTSTAAFYMDLFSLAELATMLALCDWPALLLDFEEGSVRVGTGS